GGLRNFHFEFRISFGFRTSDFGFSPAIVLQAMLAISGINDHVRNENSMNSRRAANLSQPALIPIAGSHDHKPRSLDRDVTTIGRARGNDLCLEANEISTLHCVIYR